MHRSHGRSSEPPSVGEPRARPRAPRRRPRLLGPCGAAALLLLVAAGCGGPRAVRRGDWQRVWLEEFAQHDASSPQEVISLDAYEREIAASVRRTWKPPVGWVPTPAARATELELRQGEVSELELDEASPVSVSIEGDAAEVYWTHPATIDWWEGGRERHRTSSRLLLHAKRKGRLTIHITRAGASEPQRVAVNVK